MRASDKASGLRPFAQRLLAAQQVQAMYPDRHPRVNLAVRELYLHVTGMLEHVSEIRVALADNQLVFGNTAVVERSDLFSGLAALLRRQEVGRLIITKGVRRWEVRALIAALNSPPEDLEDSGGTEGFLAHQGVEHVTAGEIKTGSDEDTVESSRSAMLPSAWETYSRGLKTLRRVRQDLFDGDGLAAVNEAAGLAAELVNTVRAQPDVFVLLHSLKVHDDYSYTHSLNVAMLSLTIARELRLTADHLMDVAMAALLHDIGKQLVPEEVLNKPGKLTEQEWQVMQQHSGDGAKLLLRTPSATDLSVIVAYEHQLAYEHDNPDHGQWPLHFASQLVCIADVYDALRSNRPYRDALPPDTAMQIMEQEADKKFDADLFDGFRKLMGHYPPGACLRLDDGRIAVSDRANPLDCRRPWILVVRNADGSEIEPPLPVSLQDTPDLAVNAVVDGEAYDIDPIDYI